MRILRPLKRSVSPFGFKDPEQDPFFGLQDALDKAYPDKPDPTSDSELISLDDIRSIPKVIKKIQDAAANDAFQLEPLCQFLISHKIELEAKNLTDVIFEFMKQLFESKTGVFLLDQNIVLFSKERDALVGRYFGPICENRIGSFSGLIDEWVSTDNPDRLLHFIDFLAGSKNRDLDHHLIFTHSVLRRILADKDQLRSFLDQAKPLLVRLSSPAWEKSVSKQLNI